MAVAGDNGRINRPRRPPVSDPQHTQLVAHLLAMGDDAFGKVVENELRTITSSRKETVPDPGRVAMSAALRSQEVLGRFHSSLLRRQRSVEGQLAARRADQIALRSRLFANGRSALVSHPEGSEPRKAEVVYLEARASYEQVRARSIRFKSAVEQLMLEVKQLREQLDPGLRASLVTEERDQLADRVRVLEGAIEAHRNSFDDPDDADEADEALWSLLP